MKRRVSFSGNCGPCLRGTPDENSRVSGKLLRKRLAREEAWGVRGGGPEEGFDGGGRRRHEGHLGVAPRPDAAARAVLVQPRVARHGARLEQRDDLGVLADLGGDRVLGELELRPAARAEVTTSRCERHVSRRCAQREELRGREKMAAHGMRERLEPGSRKVGRSGAGSGGVRQAAS